MKTRIFCKATGKGIHSFYLKNNNEVYFLFNQDYRKGVQEYYGNGVILDRATDYSKSHNDSSIKKTMSKLPMYIKYIEKEYNIKVFEKTKQKYKSYDRNYGTYCA